MRAWNSHDMQVADARLELDQKRFKMESAKVLVCQHQDFDVTFQSCANLSLSNAVFLTLPAHKHCDLTPVMS
jgi:hypothetical protein